MDWWRYHKCALHLDTVRRVAAVWRGPSLISSCLFLAKTQFEANLRIKLACCLWSCHACTPGGISWNKCNQISHSNFKEREYEQKPQRVRVQAAQVWDMRVTWKDTLPAGVLFSAHLYKYFQTLVSHWDNVRPSCKPAGTHFWTWAFTRAVPLQRKRIFLALGPEQGSVSEEILWEPVAV